MSDAELSARPEDSEPMEAWEILTEIVMALVSRPEKVTVHQRETDDTFHFLITTAPEDIGKVIGKSGETVSILRKLFGRINASRSKKVIIDVFDPNKKRDQEPRSVGYRRIVAA